LGDFEANTGGVVVRAGREEVLGGLDRVGDGGWSGGEATQARVAGAAAAIALLRRENEAFTFPRSMVSIGFSRSFSR
jgi:hypothetical protein